VKALRGRRLLHALFYIGVIAKGIDGTLEIVGGVLLLFISSTQLQPIARLLTQHELAEDPRDLVANYVLDRSQTIRRRLPTVARRDQSGPCYSSAPQGALGISGSDRRVSPLPRIPDLSLPAILCGRTYCSLGSGCVRDCTHVGRVSASARH
jgi:hypothetical protein